GRACALSPLGAAGRGAVEEPHVFGDRHQPAVRVLHAVVLIRLGLAVFVYVDLLVQLYRIVLDPALFDQNPVSVANAVISARTDGDIHVSQVHARSVWLYLACPRHHPPALIRPYTGNLRTRHPPGMDDVPGL